MPIYEPKILFNPKSETVEFMCDRKTHIFEPGEKKPVEGFVAYHAIKEVNTGLIEYEGQESKSSGIDYNSMPWKRLVALASVEEVFKPGMKRKDVVKALEELDGQETGALQEPATEEEE